jgi:REP element-mobilizing transposase RayT
MIYKQKDFFTKDRTFGPHRLAHGGCKDSGTRKLTRPLDRKNPVHLVLKSHAARGQYSLLTPKNRLFVDKTFRSRAKNFNVTIQKIENVGNHIHAIIRFKQRIDFQNFLRTVTALIARFVTGARRGKPFGRRFWDSLAFTRVIKGFEDLKGALNYLQKNAIEREFGGHAREIVELREAHRRKLWTEAKTRHSRPAN